MQGPEAPAETRSTLGECTAAPAKPIKSLKILTLDGGGIQAIAQLLLLDELLLAIGRIHGTKPPRPCDVFDTIAGIGAGGWLAILLGRFQLGITSALTEWYNLTRSMSRSRHRGYWRRAFSDTFFDTESLIRQINRLNKRYKTGPYLFPEQSEGSSERSGARPARCKYVFVAALRADSKHDWHFSKPSPSASDQPFHEDYSLFRSYPSPENPDLLQGPKDPEHVETASAFCATGAAKHFFAPWKQDMEANGRVSFIDRWLPRPHNITALALDEMWGLFGKDTPIDVVVNIGPGMPHQHDIHALAKRFSWRPGSRVSSWSSNTSKSSSGTTSSGASSRTRCRDLFRIGRRGAAAGPAGPAKTGDGTPASGSAPDRPASATRQTVPFLDRLEETWEDKLQQAEDMIENDVRKKLATAYGDDQERYFRLAPKKSPPGTPMNDSDQSDEVADGIQDYISLPDVSSMMGEASERAARGLAALFPETHLNAAANLIQAQA